MCPIVFLKELSVYKVSFDNCKQLRVILDLIICLLTNKPVTSQNSTSFAKVLPKFRGNSAPVFDATYTSINVGSLELGKISRNGQRRSFLFFFQYFHMKK